MYAEGTRHTQWRAEMFGFESLLIKPVSRFMQDTKKRGGELPGVVTSGYANIAGSDAAAEGMRRDIQPPSLEIETDSCRGAAGQYFLQMHGVIPFEDIAPRCAIGSLYLAHDLH
ncbi:hypothetical protein HRbin36_00135 [bacterium HR36]|nr:hypothetical protein HRbin36_00135 [bacterium HR36]